MFDYSDISILFPRLPSRGRYLRYLRQRRNSFEPNLIEIQRKTCVRSQNWPS